MFRTLGPAPPLARTVLFVMVAVVLLAGWGSSSPIFAADAPTEIYVSGEAQVTVDPDLATVVLAVEAQADTAPLAQEQNARRMQAIREALRTLGVEERQMSTANFRLTPIWDDPSRRSRPESEGTAPTVIAYRASHEFRVRVTDLPRLGEIIDAAVKAGADRVSHIDFSVQDTEGYRNELLARAYTDARRKAEALAQAAGLTILGPSRIDEGGFSPFMAYPAARVAVADMAATTEILPQEQRLTVRIDVTFLAGSR